MQSANLDMHLTALLTCVLGECMKQLTDLYSQMWMCLNSVDELPWTDSLRLVCTFTFRCVYSLNS